MHSFPSFFCCWERSRSFNDKRDTDTHNPSFSSKVFEVKEFDCNLTREMVDLIDREADMLNRGRPEKSFAGRQGMGKKDLFDWGSWGLRGLTTGACGVVDQGLVVVLLVDFSIHL